MSGALASALVQSFTTVPTVNTNLAVYSLSIRAPGVDIAEVQTYTFPLSPEQLRKEPVVLSSVYDVQGPPSLNGVQRLVDQYGMAPPTFIIEGTTGWQRHSTDMFLYTGLQSIQQLEQLISTYIQLNQGLISTGHATNLYTLEFYDYFRQDYWQVEPIGPQGIRQNSQRPLLTYYQFRLVAIKQVNMPIIDYLEERLFTQAAAVAMRSVLSFVSPLLTAY